METIHQDKKGLEAWVEIEPTYEGLADLFSSPPKSFLLMVSWSVAKLSGSKIRPMEHCKSVPVTLV